jgi:hypothetical protein
LQSSIFSNLEEKEVLSLVTAEAEEGALPLVEAEEGALPLVAAEEKGALLLLAAKAPEGKEAVPCVSTVAAADSIEKEALSLVASPATEKGALLLAGGGRAAAGKSGG